jgi:hypothetical protein
VKKIKIDATDVDSDIRKRSKTKRIPEGEYVAKVHNVELLKTKDGSGRYLRWGFIITEGPHKGVTVWGNTSLKKDALWSLRNLIHAATGKNIAGKVATFDPESLIGRKVGISVTDNEYTKDGQTKITSQFDSAFPKEEVNATEDDEDEEDDDEEEDEDVEEEDEDDDEEEEEKPKKKAKGKKKAKDETMTKTKTSKKSTWTRSR